MSEIGPNRGRAFASKAAGALALLAALWGLFAFADTALPYVRPGAEVVYAAKAEAIASARLFRPDAPVKLVIFGNSKVLSGFRPALFDELSGGLVSSYNLGLPDYLLFVDNLERLCRRGERPTHVLLPFPWPGEPDQPFDLFRPGIKDELVMDRLFPFRKLPRNLMVFAARARSKGGPRAFYEECRRQTEAMLAQRGYYFIEGQSHYPGHRLPDDFRLQKDDPSRPFTRPVPLDARAFHQLREVLDRCDTRAIFVPVFQREGEYAPVDGVSPVAAALAPFPRFATRGPDYWAFPNRAFSDPEHLNEEGAGQYTRRLWDLLGAELLAAARPDVVRAPR